MIVLPSVAKISALVKAVYSSVVKLEHLMLSSVKYINLPQMLLSRLHLLQQRVNEMKCLKQTVTLNSCLPLKRKLWKNSLNFLLV